MGWLDLQQLDRNGFAMANEVLFPSEVSTLAGELSVGSHSEGQRRNAQSSGCRPRCYDLGSSAFVVWGLRVDKTPAANPIVPSAKTLTAIPWSAPGHPEHSSVTLIARFVGADPFPACLTRPGEEVVKLEGEADGVGA